MTPAELRETGERLYGNRWQTTYPGTAVESHLRTVQRWLSGERQIKPMVADTDEHSYFLNASCQASPLAGRKGGKSIGHIWHSGSQ